MNFYMYWWWKEGRIPNFGDAINPYLVEKLGKNVHVKYVSSRPYKECLIFVLSALKHLKKPELGRLRKLYRFNRYAIAIGSILNGCKKGQVVWGSGFMNENEKVYGGKILAVRGYETINRLKELNVKVPNVVGDPALLLPLVYKPNINKRYKYGIIAHIKDYENVKTQVQNNNCLIIDLKTDNIEKIIDQILSCEIILSSSLHGLIVSHAYLVPAIWIKFGEIGTDGFKFIDYFSSVNIPYYQPIDGNKIDFNNINICSIYNKYMLGKNLKNIQCNLLSCAPFPIKSIYRMI